ncbi:MAG: PH domain-containing protein, partial [Cyanobacteriota bacterium]|nr:PH domain-containing protein [Cyanobacteriota bacterium]
RDGSRLELRAVPMFRKTYEYISQQVAARNPKFVDAAKS